jgi:predicted DNA-binding transcriptional regulator YafY
VAYKSGFFSQFSRKLTLLDRLGARRHPVGLAELAHDLGVSEKTIRRDLHDLAESGKNLRFSYDDSSAGRTQVQMASKSFIQVALTRAEAHWLAATRRLWAPFAGTTFHDAMEQVIAKILENVSDAERAEIEADTARFLFVPTGGVRDYRGKRDELRALQKAVTRRRRVAYAYRTPQGKRLAGVLEPLAFVIYGNAIYVFARRLGKDAAAHEYVRWPADRFAKVEVLREEFVVPEGFRIEDHFDGFGIISEPTRERVVVDFDEQIAPYIVERVWPGMVTIAPREGGWLRLELDTANLLEVKTWLASHTGHVVVRAPARLREAMRRDLERAIALDDAATAEP